MNRRDSREADQIVRQLRRRDRSEEWLGIDSWLLSSVQPRIDDYCEFLSQLPLRHIRVTIRPDDYLIRECYDKFQHVIASLETLEELDLSVWAEVAQALPIMATYVHRARQIRVLVLRLPFTAGNRAPTLDDVPAFRATLLDHHPNLEEIRTVNWLPDEIRMLSMTIPNHHNLRVATFEHCQMNSTIIPEFSNDAFGNLFHSSLRAIDIWGYKIPMPSLQAIAQALGNNGSHVSKLVFSDCKFPTEQGSLLAESLKTNTALTELSFRGCRPDSSFFSALKDGLSGNRTLTRLELVCLPLLESEANDMALAVKANYYLENITFGLRPDAHAYSVIMAIEKLNRAGRFYLLDDSSSIRKGVEVLSQVVDDLDCLFLHLTENPGLCRPPPGKKQQKSPRRKRKRKVST